MRACHPRDLVEQVGNICRYQNRQPVIMRDLLDAACSSYFRKRPTRKERKHENSCAAGHRPGWIGGNPMGVDRGVGSTTPSVQGTLPTVAHGW